MQRKVQACLRVSWYHIKISDTGALGNVEYPFIPSLPGSLWSRVLSMSRIIRNCCGPVKSPERKTQTPGIYMKTSTIERKYKLQHR